MLDLFIMHSLEWKCEVRGTHLCLQADVVIWIIHGLFKFNKNHNKL